MLDSSHQMFALIKAYFLQFPEEKTSLLPQCAFIEKAQDPFIRSNLPGHITGSGFVIRGDEMLLIHHRYIKEWFQPGGHVDPGENPYKQPYVKLEKKPVR
jgi:hypothetical protein